MRIPWKKSIHEDLYTIFERLEEGSLATDYIAKPSKEWKSPYITRLLRSVVNEVRDKKRRCAPIKSLEFYLKVDTKEGVDLLKNFQKEYIEQLKNELETEPGAPKLSDVAHNALTSALVGYILGYSTSPEVGLIGAAIGAILGFTGTISIKEVLIRLKRGKSKSQLEALNALKIIKSEETKPEG